jgi:exopolysaccharide biosynthesis predicted pyruvyltransferase EpsI
MTPDAEADAVVAELQRQTLGTLQEAIAAAAGSTVALLDFPSHQNVGDSMIWAGEAAYLRRLGLRVGYRADHHRFEPRALRRLPGDAPVLLHGGGNFGDLWPEYQAFRERIVADMRDRAIVQLPQSVWFASPRSAARANRVLGGHPRFTLLVRDSESLARVCEQLPDVRAMLCPDAALGLGSIAPRTVAQRRDIALLRGDREAGARGSDAFAVQGFERVDWGLRGGRSWLWKAVRAPGRVHRCHPRARPLVRPLVGRGYDAMIALNIDAGVRMFSGAQRLVTDRLHAHVLAALMGIPHVVLDLGYGKIHAVFADYTHRFPSAHCARDVGEARRLLESLDRDRPPLATGTGTDG